MKTASSFLADLMLNGEQSDITVVVILQRLGVNAAATCESHLVETFCCFTQSR